MHRKLDNYCKGMNNLLAQILDLTYPAVSMLRGRSFNRCAVLMHSCVVKHQS